MKYSRPIGFPYFYRPINIILSADLQITLISPKTLQSADISADDKGGATIGRSSANGRPTHRPMICESFKYEIGRLIGRSMADHLPIAKTPKLSADGKKL